MTIKIIKSRCRNWNRMQNNRFYLKIFEEKRYFKTRNMLIYFLKHVNNQFVNSKLYCDFLRRLGEISYLSVIKFNVRKIKSCKYKLAHFSLLIVVHLFHICTVCGYFPMPKYDLLQSALWLRWDMSYNFLCVCLLCYHLFCLDLGGKIPIICIVSCCKLEKWTPFIPTPATTPRYSWVLK